MEWQGLNTESNTIWEANAAFWDRYMGDEGNSFHRQLVAPSALRLLDLQRGERVLEIACGGGIFSRQMAALGVEVVAFDVSATFVERAKARAGDSFPQIEYHVIDATDTTALLALGERQFDAAVCNMALMDIPAIEPLLDALPRLLKPGGRFVFTIMHPCFNSAGLTRVIESSDEGGELTTTYSVKISHYQTPKAFKGIGIAGQPKAQYYFHRPLHQLFGLCFQRGFVMNGIEEPTFEPDASGKVEASWENFREIPPILAARMVLSRGQQA